MGYPIDSVLIFWEHDEIAEKFESLIGIKSDIFFDNKSDFTTNDWEIRLSEWLEENNLVDLLRLYDVETEGWMGTNYGRLVLGVSLNPQDFLNLEETIKKINKLISFSKLAKVEGFQLSKPEIMAINNDDCNTMFNFASDNFH